MGSRNLRRMVLVCALLVAVPLAFAQANKPATGDVVKYDVSKEVTIKGKVEEVQKVEGAKGRVGIYLLVKADAEVLEVRLCPRIFLETIDVQFAKGDDLTIIGAKVKANEKTLLLAREITRGESKLVLREKDGSPVWTWLLKEKE